MKYNRKKKKAQTALPKILRNPFIPAAIAAALDVLILAAAVLLHIFSAKLPRSYVFENGGITKHCFTDYFGAAAAVVMTVCIVMAALVIASGIARKRGEGGSAALFSAISMGAGLLALSSGVCIFAMNFVGGATPESVAYYGYTNDTAHILFAEEKYPSGNTLCIYDVDDKSGEAKMLVQTELMELSDSDERYKLSDISEDVLYVAFSDGGRYRTFQIEY